ncbi:MAG: hypothetical protein ACKOKF_11585 [Bacteroidota bacterium]
MNRSLLLIVLLLTILSCGKDTLDLSDSFSPDIPAVPTSFGQNVLIEQFTQASNGQCPVTDSLLSYVRMISPDRICPVNIHVSDALCPAELTDTSTGGNVLNSFFNSSGSIPAGMMNRKVTDPTDLSPLNYESRLNSTLSLVPRCGVALDANDIRNGYLNLSVHVGYSADLPGAYRLHVYLVRKTYIPADSGLVQSNDFSQNGTTPLPGTTYYDLPDPVYFYRFPYVLEKVLTSSADGLVIPESSALKGKSYVKNLIVDMRGKNTDDYLIVAFVDKYGPTAGGHRVENARMVEVGNVSPWN